MTVVDGASLLRWIEEQPEADVVLSYEQARAVFRALAGAQAVIAGQERLGIAMLTIGRGEGVAG